MHIRATSWRLIVVVTGAVYLTALSGALVAKASATPLSKATFLESALVNHTLPAPDPLAFVKNYVTKMKLLPASGSAPPTLSLATDCHGIGLRSVVITYTAAATILDKISCDGRTFHEEILRGYSSYRRPQLVEGTLRGMRKRDLRNAHVRADRAGPIRSVTAAVKPDRVAISYEPLSGRSLKRNVTKVDKVRSFFFGP